MPTTTLVSNHLLSLDAVHLGRLVLSVKDPEQEFYQPDSFSVSKDDMVVQQLEKFQDILLCTMGSRFHALLSGAFSTTYCAKDTKIDIDSALCSTYQLKNSSDFFHKVCKLESAQNWLENAIRRRKNVYLVVGIKTLTDARISQQVRGSIETGRITGQFPVAASAVPATGKISIEASQKKEFNNGADSFAPGEQIYAVQYRKIEFAWFSSRSVDNAFPESGNRWKVYLGVGGGEEENDIVEAELQDYLQKGDLEEPCESVPFENGELLYFKVL